MSNIAVPRPNYTGGPIEEYFAANPSVPLPRGYRREGNRVVRDTRGFWDDLAKWGSRAGIAAAGGYMAAPLFAGGAAAGAGGAGTTGVAGLGGATASLPAVGAATGAGAAAGGGMTLSNLLQYGGAALPLLSGLLNRGGEEPPMNDAMEQLLRQQSQRMSQADPLYQAILRMAQGLLPRSAMQSPGQTRLR